MMTRTCRQHCSIYGITTLFVCAFFSNRLLATATTQYCDNDPGKNHFELSLTALESASMELGAEVDFTRHEVSAGIGDKGIDALTMDFNFQYTIIDVDNTLTPMTNGHLHTWSFPLSRRSSNENHELFYYLAPAVSVSSNALKNPDLIDAESLQLWAGLVYKKDLAHNNAWFAGFQSDHRFGRYLAYPVFGLCWQPNTNWQMQLALPDFSIRRVFSNGIHIKLFAEPDGNQWHVFSDDETMDSDFTYDAIVAGLSIEWHISSTIKLGIDALKHTRRRFSFVLDDGTQVESRADPGTGVTVSAGVLF